MVRLSEITPARLREIDDKELLSLHRRLHQLYGRTKTYTKEDMINFHKLVEAEMRKRGMNHEIHDELDKESAAFLRKSEDVIVVPEFISIVGSVARGEEEPGDIDIVIRAERTARGFLIQPENIELPIRNILDPEKEGKLHYIPNPQGPHGDYIPVFDLVLRAREPEVRKVSAKEIKPIMRYTPQKPWMAGYTEFFSAEELWDKWAKERAETHDFMISPKIDGYRTIIQKAGDRVSIWFEDSKEERADQLPTIVEAVQQYPDCIIEGELQVKVGNRFVARPEIMSFLAGKIEGRPYVFLYDLLYFQEDMHKDPFDSRYEFLKEFDKAPFVVLPQYHAEAKEQFLKAAEKAIKWESRFGKVPVEGVVARIADMPYRFGATQDYAKFKLWVELKVKVLAVEKTANGYTYECALRSDEGDVRLGKTFVSEERLADPGDTLNVKVEELILYPDGSVAWGKPYPQGLDKSRPAYLIKQAIDIARRGHCLKEAVQKLKDEGETRADKAEAFWKKNWYSIYPKSGKGRFIYHWHFRGLSEEEKDLNAEELLKRGRSVHGDLRLEGDGALWGFTIFLGKPEDVLKGKDLTNLGGRKLQGTFKLAQPKEWLEIGDPPYISEPGEVGATSRKYAKFFKIDEGTYEMGVWREHMFEIFLHGKKIKGRHIIEYAPVAGRRIWLIEKPEDQTPYAEKNEKEEIIEELKRKKQEYLIWCKPGEKPQLINVLRKHVLLLRAKPHYVLAPVLVPDEPDWYGDIVDEEEIRRAATEWLNNYRGFGILHKLEFMDEEETVARVADSFVAPTDLQIDGTAIKKGTWLIGAEILSPELWKLIEKGAITGFSIDGLAIREEVEGGETER